MIRILTDVTAGLSRSIDQGGLLAKTLDVVSIAVKGVDVALAVGIATVETFYQVFKTEMAAIGDITVSVGRLMKDAFTLNFDDIKAAFADLKSKLQTDAKGLATEMGAIVKTMERELGSLFPAEGGKHGSDKPQAPSPNTNARDQLKAQIDAIN